jgi:hypothetical protein
LREKLSSEKLEDRIKKMIAVLNSWFWNYSFL